MKRTVSMAVLGIAMAGSSAMAGDFSAAPDPAAPGRAAPPQQRAAEPRDERGRGPFHGSRGDSPSDRGDRGNRDWDRGGGRGDDRRFRGARPDFDGSRRSDWDDRGRRDRDPRGWRDDRGRDWRHGRDWYDRYRAEHFRDDRGRYLARQRFSLGLYVVPRGYAPRHWQRGQWLPSSYYAERRHHLAEYWRFDLYDPPFGTRWVRVGSDALLIDYGSGEVLDVVFELFW
jgi:Ni/Co efflux regulator RcnB